MVYRSCISIEDSFKQEICQALLADDLDAEILSELEGIEMKEMVKKNEKYRKKNELLVVYLKNQ